VKKESGTTDFVMKGGFTQVSNRILEFPTKESMSNPSREKVESTRLMFNLFRKLK
jgi:N-acetylglucosamine kinase-like BadF-type ATPase